jgi:hypothetical protein
MPSKSPAQARLMAAVAHGWKPDRIKGPPVKVAVEFNEADTGKKVRKVKRASGGPVRDPLSIPPTSPRGALGSLGSTARVGDLGGATRPRGGLSKRPSSTRARAGTALSGRPLPRPAPPSNVSPRAGRGANPLLATSALPSFEASDRLESLRRRIKP